MRNKLPAMQVYPGDWKREPGIAMASLMVRGAWWECLLAMHDSNPRGVLSGSISQLASFWRCTVYEACHVVIELEVGRIATVQFLDEETSKWAMETHLAYTENPQLPANSADFFRQISAASSMFVTIICRRMFREHFSKEKDRLRKAGQVLPTRLLELSNIISGTFPQNVRPPSSSSSSSSSSKQRKVMCSERLKIASSPASDSSPVFLQVPLKNGNAYPVTESDVAFWEDAYRSVDVRRALKQIAAWNDANPGKRKTARGIRKHITAWLSRDQDKILFPAGNNGNPFAETPPAGRDPNRWTVEDVNGAPDWED